MKTEKPLKKKRETRQSYHTHEDASSKKKQDARDAHGQSSKLAPVRVATRRNQRRRGRVPKNGVDFDRHAERFLRGKWLRGEDGIRRLEHAETDRKVTKSAGEVPRERCDGVAHERRAQEDAERFTRE